MNVFWHFHVDRCVYTWKYEYVRRRIKLILLLFSARKSIIFDVPLSHRASFEVIEVIEVEFEILYIEFVYF